MAFTNRMVSFPPTFRMSITQKRLTKDDLVKLATDYTFDGANSASPKLAASESWSVNVAMSRSRDVQEGNHRPGSPAEAANDDAT